VIKIKSMTTQRLNRSAVAVALLALAGALGACAAMNDAMQKAQSGLGGPAGSGAPGSGDPASSGEGAATPAPDGAKPGGGGGDGKTYCCQGPDKSSMSYYDCKTVENAVKCLGNPFEISPCSQKCSGPDSQKCVMKCMEDYGPNPARGNCQAVPSKNAECKQ